MRMQASVDDDQVEVAGADDNRIARVKFVVDGARVAVTP